MFALWLDKSETAGFFLLLSLVVMALVRWRFPKLAPTLLADATACAFLVPFWGHAQYALILVIFEGMYRRLYWVVLFGIFFSSTALFANYYSFAALTALAALCGLFLGKWEQEHEHWRTLRDTEAGKFYKLENRQHKWAEALPRIERMTAVAERARIAREIHDNAGHEIVSAYISFQTMRQMIDSENSEVLELYDAALERLSSGVEKVRETAHNLQTVTSTGVASLLETCKSYPGCPVDFHTYGDTSKIPVYVWSILEACLNESLTNVTRHANANYVSVELDVTRHIIRLCIENDGGRKGTGKTGMGLSNLRHRVISIGGSFSVDSDEIFRIICVIPIQEEGNEFIDS